MKLPSLAIDYRASTPDRPSSIIENIPFREILNPKKFLMIAYVSLLDKHGRFEDGKKYLIQARINRRLRVIGRVRNLD